MFAISNDTLVSNIPAEFCVVPVATPPILSPENSSVNQGDSIRVSMSRKGEICLVAPNIFFKDTLRMASEIMNSSTLIESADALADSEVSFRTDDLSTRIYWIYGFDQYGIVTGPIAVQLVPVGISTDSQPEIILYPNPVKETVTFQTSRNAIYDLSIFSLNGQLLKEEKMEGTTYQPDLASFQKGVYFITIRSMDFVTTKKIIKL